MGNLGYSSILGYNRHFIAKREAESDAEAYTPAQVALGQTNGGVITGVDYGYGAVSGFGAIGNRAVAYAATPSVAAVTAVSYTSPLVSKVSAPAVVSTYNTAPAVVSTYNTLPYNTYAHTNLGYSGILGYNRHFIAKREAEAEADAYTPAQVAHGLPYANAVATGHAHNAGHVTNAVVAPYNVAVPATTYSHAVPATTYAAATLPYAAGYTGRLGYGYGLRSSLWL